MTGDDAAAAVNPLKPEGERREVGWSREGGRLRVDVGRVADRI
ncbi:MAG: hypothetical protein OXI72_12395 [Gemmatimonadota bacterium]|nr:hypothetical protein [Gemmatimonadota bacterium]